MAKRSSASPAPQPASTRTAGRATRSGTNEPQPAPKSSAKRSRGATGQAGAPASTLSGPEAAQAGLAALGQVRGLNASGLDTVDEEDGHVILPLNDDGTHNVFASQTASVGGASAFTGLTGRTTFSQEELRNLDRDTILGNLSQLNRSAEDILTYVAPFGLSTEDELTLLQSHTFALLDEQSRLRKSLLPRLKSLHELKAGFGGHTYINNDLILRCLLDIPGDTPVLSTPWRFDEILFKVNLVSLLEKVFTIRGDDAIFQLTQALDSQFPRFALDTLVSEQSFRGLAGESKMWDATYTVALEIRTQLFIRAIQQGAADGFETALIDLFLAEDDEPGYMVSDGSSTTNLRLFNFSVSDDLQSTIYSKVNERLGFLKRFASQANEDLQAVVNTLKTQFPWDECCFSILEWSHIRHEELSQIIEQRGGADHIVSVLEDKVREIDSRMDPRLTGTSRQGTPRTLLSKPNIEALRKRRLRLSGHSAASAAVDAGPIEEGLFGSQSNIAHFGNDDDEEMARTLTAFKANDHVGGRFIDHQDGAQRVDFEESQPSFSGTPMKRARFEDFSPSQDQGFQTDTRQHSIPSRAPRAVMTGGRNVLPRTSYAGDVSESSSARRPRQNPGRAIEPIPQPTLDENNLPNPTLGEAYQLTKQIAKQNVINHAKPPRQRTKFSTEEEEQILALIAEFGPEYSKIKAADEDSRGNVLALRTGEDIRFKARNIKMDFLKARTALPPGFDQVNLGKKEMDRLDALGIPYEQEARRSTNRSSSIM